MKLVIVESPAKAKTVGRFLGKGYTVRASVGHVRYLLKSQLSVDVDNNFEPKYRVPNEKKDVVKEIKQFLGRQIKKAKKAGIKDIIIDPGIAFGKTTEHNLKLLKNLPEKNWIL